MTDFKVGDRVVVAEDARFADGSRSDENLVAGLGTVTASIDDDGDIRVKPDGSEYSYYVGTRDVTREPVFVTLSEIKVGDKIRATETLSSGDVSVYSGIVTAVTARRVELASAILYTLPNRTFEILESAPEPAPKFKVGDTVEGQANYDRLPVGALLDNPNVSSGNGTIFRTHNGWVNSNGNTQSYVYVTRVIVWLPEEKENA